MQNYSTFSPTPYSIETTEVELKHSNLQRLLILGGAVVLVVSMLYMAISGFIQSHCKKYK